MKGSAALNANANAREVGPQVLDLLMYTNRGTTLTLAKGTIGIESASRAERATTAQPEALGMTRPGTGVRCHHKRCQPSTAKLLRMVLQLGEGERMVNLPP